MSPRRRRRAGGDGGAPGRSAPGWMVTYSDLVTLILVFFVLLFSFSTLDIQRFRAAMVALQGSWGILERGRAVDPRQRMDFGSLQEMLPLDMVTPAAQLQEMVDELEDFIRENQLQDQVEVKQREWGVIVTFADQVLFDLGKADLKPESLEILDRVAETLRRWPNQVRVEGHTDNWPINTPQFPSNWELSTARATRVLRYLVEQRGLDPTRFAAVGYGEFRPLRPNDTPENRAVNRRVDIVLLRSDLFPAEASDGPAFGRSGDT